MKHSIVTVLSVLCALQFFGAALALAVESAVDAESGTNLNEDGNIESPVIVDSPVGPIAEDDEMPKMAPKIDSEVIETGASKNLGTVPGEEVIPENAEGKNDSEKHHHDDHKPHHHRRHHHERHHEHNHNKLTESENPFLQPGPGDDFLSVFILPDEGEQQPMDEPQILFLDPPHDEHHECIAQDPICDCTCNC